MRVLNTILFASHENRRLKVRDILMLSEVASPATLHAALQKLISKGLVEHMTSRQNRSKHLKLTASAMDRYNHLLNIILPAG